MAKDENVSCSRINACPWGSKAFFPSWLAIHMIDKIPPFTIIFLISPLFLLRAFIVLFLFLYLFFFFSFLFS
ncbi:hypothetical protein BCR41DRAFT_345401 [Lobosporangium transversale]|uniref:Uncharacterized protein n=1 Tax=Lobosporangium transversale TaxID=64571 RepID=A0A1Y2H1N3_9FUNG|nr:hypothetical protein BCR41DRAFT_345401 [Lobosporangium transversale]ORZ28479.1 hypothetical protein BCR41DRAFT_345401 [Lobosporangium transversale]|eukprot:XP_021886164.1 hypothetical protein BCR41DRAFT_345401 [Lobosporangium transversale]